MFIEIYLFITLIATLIILFTFLKSFTRAIGSNGRNYLIYPLVSLVSLGAFLHLIDFKYITPYITVCGPVLGACVAIYVASSNNEITKNKEKDKRIAQLDHTKEILKVCLDVISLESGNYQKLISNLNNSLSGLPYLSSTPFYLLEVLSNSKQSELYSSFLENDKLSNLELKEIYLAISKNISNALYVKTIFDKTYPGFIERYNVYAEKWTQARIQMNKCYRQNRITPSNNNSFNSSLIHFTLNYNQKVATNTISHYNLTDQRQHYFNPLKALIISSVTNDPVFLELLDIIEVMKISLDKLDEIMQIVIKQYTDLSGMLDDINSKISVMYAKIV